MLGKLDRRGTQRSGGPIDQDPLSRPDAPAPKEVQRASRSPRDRRRFLEGYVEGLDGSWTVFFQTGVLGIRFHTEPEDQIPRFESSHLLSDRFDLSGEVRPEDRFSGPKHNRTMNGSAFLKRTSPEVTVVAKTRTRI